MKLTVLREGAMKIEANRTELIRLANELLIRAGCPEYDFDFEARYEVLSRNFTFDESIEMMGPDGLREVEGIAFVRQEEVPPQQSALENEALDVG